MPESGLHILEEAFLRVRISLMGVPGTSLDDIRDVRAHLVLLPQSANFLRALGIRSHAAADSAGAAADLAKTKTPGEGVLASELAAEIHGLDILARDIEDHGHNTTRFVIMGRDIDLTRRGKDGMMTTFVFEVATRFYADIEGHPDDPPVARALEELEYFTNNLDILGVYPADARRHRQLAAAAGG